MDLGNLVNLVVMLIVGALAGTLAARIMKGKDFGMLINSLLGIGGAIVGGMLFNVLGITPGAGITKTLSSNFGVDLPTTFVGMIVAATVGAVLILFLAKLVRRG